MKGFLIGLLLIWSVDYNDSRTGFLLQEPQSRCPKIQVDAPPAIDADKGTLAFTVKLLGGDGTIPALTFKWTVHNGEISEGQGTATVTVINFDLCKKTLVALIEVGGLPEGCATTASSSMSVRCLPERIC